VQRLIRNRENRHLPGISIPAKVQLTADESRCFGGCTMVVSAMPTQYLRAAWERVAPHVPLEVPIVSVSKGIENGTLLRPTQIIAEALAGPRASRLAGQTDRQGKCAWNLAVLSGPNIAAEVARKLPATGVVAAEDPVLAQRVRQTFATHWFRVYTNSDVTGVEVAGAVKNVIALAAGILDGLGAGNNAKAALVTRGLVEIARFGAAVGARSETFTGLAGLGDLITTCVSPDGRNRRVGEEVGKGRRLDEVLNEMPGVAEGVPTARAVRELARRYGVEMPIADAVARVLFDGQDPAGALGDLMMRDAKPETAG
jgi:glycerol-3-phosphate dehydrogenase (NAD(P)+)